MAESKRMMKEEISFMKRKGAPKRMIRHEEEEMRGKGKKMKKYARGGYTGSADGISRVKTKGRFV